MSAYVYDLRNSFRGDKFWSDEYWNYLMEERLQKGKPFEKIFYLNLSVLFRCNFQLQRRIRRIYWGIIWKLKYSKIKNSKIESKTSWILKSIRKYNPNWKLKNPDYHKDYFCVTKNAVRLILTRPACDLPTPGSN